MLRLVPTRAGHEILVHVGPTREAVVSWNARARDGIIDLRADAHDGRTSTWMPYVAFTASERASLAGAGGFVRIDTDVVRADVDIVALGIRSQGPLDALFVSTPDDGAPSSDVALPAVRLDVPRVSQYDPAHPDERGWCAPASLAMLLAYRGFSLELPVVAREVYDRRYGGTGNWTLNAAYAGTLGFRSAVVHLRDVAHAHAFLFGDIPLALSIAWRAGELPGAPLAESPGHLVVLCGIDPSGDPVVNDPAQPDVVHVYPRGAFERAWLGHGGVAFAVAPAALGAALIRLANE